MKYFFKPDWRIILISLVVISTTVMIGSIIKWNSIASLLFFLLIVAILISSTALLPMWLEVTDVHIRVKLVVGSRTFLKNKVKISRISKKDIQDSIHIVGFGGSGRRYTGWFRNQLLGKFFMLIVNRNELALITTEKGTKVVINYPKNLLV